MSQRPKSKNPEVRRVAQDIREIVEGLDPAVANRWFHFKPNAKSSKQQENYSPLPSPEKLPHKRKAETVKSEPIDLSLDSDDESDHATASSSKKRKKTTSTDAANPEPIEMSFCVYVETPPPPILSMRKPNTKALPAKTTTLGPFECISSFTFPDFLNIIATACQTNTANLVLPSLQWKFDRPNNSKLKPVTNATGFKVMVKVLTDRHKDYVFSIFMAPPTFIKAELPWKESRNEGPSVPLNFEYGIDDMQSQGSVLSIRDQLAGIDKASSTELNELLEEYPINNNPLFPGKRILHNATGFFDLTDIKLRVWAVARAQGKATLKEPPASNHFFKNQTIKPPNPLAVIPPPAPAPLPAVPDLIQLLLANPNVLQTAIQIMNPFPHAAPHHCGQMHQPYPPPYPHHAPYLPPHGLPGPAPLQPPPQPAEPELVELPREISLEEYCKHYKINGDDRRVMNEIGYIPGDNGIKDLDANAWAATKVLPLAKGHILCQHAVFLKDVRNGLWN
ncbi:hypothetical protein B0H16DRAFT_1476962 [Mycena metata]|uniref:Uncharacterized protein n=1 Tax=Mycena metata TaxID=1033252 RepID=A0AAD7HA32_9AGAR|nr:hypothetical protein B0H16DRAFT_1476962 [Mycena metata]